MSDRNTKLMKEMGSKSGRWDPEPLAQWQWQLQNGSPGDQFVAWVKSRTVTVGHHSPYATDDHGGAVYIDQAAADLGWALKTAQNVAYQVHAEGRIRLERKKKRIWLCAEVTPQAAVPEDSETNNDGRIKGELFDFVQSQFASYVVDFIQSLENGKKDVVVRDLAGLVAWQKTALAAAVAQVRHIAARVEDSILLRAGLEKKRLPARKAPATSPIQLTLLEVPGFCEAEFIAVQSQNGDAVYKVKNESVQTQNGLCTAEASLLSSDQTPDQTDSSSYVGLVGKCGDDESPTEARQGHATNQKQAEQETEIDRIATELKFDRKAAKELIAKCRELEPDITVARIIELAHQKVRQQHEAGRFRNREIPNLVGFLLTAVPNMLEPFVRRNRILRVQAAGGD